MIWHRAFLVVLGLCAACSGADPGGSLAAGDPAVGGQTPSGESGTGVMSSPVGDADEPVASSAETPIPEASTRNTSRGTPSGASSVNTTPDGVGEFAVPRKLTEAELAAMDGVSWRAGCPVSPAQLRVVQVWHYTETQQVQSGELVVHSAIAADISQIFQQMYAAGFPVHSVRPIREFGGDDDASMAANNTSGFNCREVSGKPGVWSQHAYGRAIDVNPLWNPYVPRGRPVQPAAGQEYVDRSNVRPGMLVAGSVPVRAFTQAGFVWGALWPTMTDYQHFHKTR